MITNFFPRMAYVELLVSYNTKEVLSFLRALPNFKKDFLDSLWFEEKLFKYKDHKIFLDTLWEWLGEKGVNPAHFIENVFSRLVETDYISSRMVLRSYIPFIPRFYNAKDVRRLNLEVIPENNSYLKNAKVIFNEREEGLRTDYLLFREEAGREIASHYMPWIETYVRYSPVFLTTPPYELIQSISYQNNALDLLMEYDLTAQVEADELIVDGKVVGKKVAFGEILEKNGISWENDQEKESICIRVDENVMKPYTGTLILKAGTVYNAPLSILKISYEAGVQHPDPLANMMSSLVRQEFEVWKPIQKAHEALLNEINESIEIVYYKKDDSIALNNRHLMRNVPARILRNVIKEYLKTGREEFENREFKRDPDICVDSLRPNFESRLNRVLEHSKRVSEHFEFERHRRGGFRFIPHSRIVFKEED